MIIVSAVTTCPREGVDYLPDALDSICNAGFSVEIVRDDNMAGSWWVLREALKRLLERPAEAYCVFQDDIRVAKGCRKWLESQLWPIPYWQVGVISLYTASTCHVRDGWFSSEDMPVVRAFGALGLVFPRHTAELVLSHKDKSMLTGSDTTLAGLCHKHKRAWMNHSPSLIEHVGAVSAISPLGPGLNENRTAGKWIDDVALLEHT